MCVCACMCVCVCAFFCVYVCTYGCVYLPLSTDLLDLMVEDVTGAAAQEVEAGVPG